MGMPDPWCDDIAVQNFEVGVCSAQDDDFLLYYKRFNIRPHPSGVWLAEGPGSLWR
jgi:hypothetical protein